MRVFVLISGLFLLGYSNKLSSQTILADSLEKVADNAYLNGIYDIALKNYQELSKIYERNGDWKKQLNYTISIAEVLRASQLYSESIEQLIIAKDKAAGLNNAQALARIYNRLAGVYFEKLEFSSCQKYLDSSNTILQTHPSPSTYASNLLIRGALFEKLKKHAQAKEKLYQALQICQQESDYPNFISTVFNLSKLYQDEKKWDSSLHFAEMGIEASIKHNIKAQLNYGYLIKAQAYLGKEDFEKAYYTYQTYNEIDDEYKNTTSKKRLEFYNTIFDLERKETENKVLKLENQKSRILQYFFLVLGLLLAITIYYFYYKSKKFKALNKALAENESNLLVKNAELDQLNKILSESTTEQTKLLSLNNQLFSILSHDLKNPLNSLLMTLELAEDESISIEETKEVLSNLKVQTKNLNVLLDNLLTWSKSQLQGYHFNFIEIELQKILKSEIQIGKLMAVNKGIKTIVSAPEEPILLRSDKDIIQLIFRNIYMNAIKFTDAGGTIKVKMEVEGENAVLAIEDNGIGMTEETIKNLNKPKFSRSYGTAKESGAGLGLAICHNFIKEIGGHLAIKSQPQKGTTITCYFPLNISK